MSEALYVAMSGAQQTMHAQAVNANNLANVRTTGFRSDIYNATSVALFNDTIPDQVYAVSAEPKSNFNSGPIMTTSRELDIAIEGDGWIAVQNEAGQEAYTRAGNLRLNANGQLLTGNGHAVLGNGGSIAIPPAEKIQIGKDGTINIRPVGQSAQALATIDRIKLVKPEHDSLKKGEDGLFYMTDGASAPADGAVKIVSGALEGSNVNAVEAMINIISLARQFEMQMKLMKQADTNGELLSQLIQTPQ